MSWSSSSAVQRGNAARLLRRLQTDSLFNALSDIWMEAQPGGQLIEISSLGRGIDLDRQQRGPVHLRREFRLPLGRRPMSFASGR